MQAVFGVSLAILFLLAIGITHIRWAHGIAQFYRGLYPSNGFLGALFSPFRVWVEGAYYETWLRVVGAVCIGVALFLLFVMLHGLLSG
jgi:hypothetical protein